MSRATFGADADLGKRLTKKRAAAIARHDRMMHPPPSTEELRMSSEQRARERWHKQVERIVVGEKYTRHPYIHIPGLGCECEGEIRYPEPDVVKMQCWLARTSSSMILRVHELAFVDLVIGPGYSVTMVRPSIWQFRAWVRGGPDRDLEDEPMKWHTIAAIVPGAHLAERVR